MPKGPAVLRVTQSPLNKQQWSLDLECGHEQWITSATKPNKKTMHCRTCDAGADQLRDYPVVGRSDGHTWIEPRNVLIAGARFISCRDCGMLRRPNNKRCKGVVKVGPK